jgi:ABC-type nitrate/sulfonate/bicarbonate transport system ATPase subunit
LTPAVATVCNGKHSIQHSEHRRGLDPAVAILSIDHVSVAFGTGPQALPVVDDVSLFVDEGEFLCLLGPSGCGKSTLLKVVAGLLAPRAGIARALVADPRILLMDEPFAAVDAQTRRILQEQVLALSQELRKTVVFVTHSIEEALLLGDRVAVMSARPGRIKSIIDVRFPRPRGAAIRRTAEFQDLEEHIWLLLRDEAARAELAA